MTHTVIFDMGGTLIGSPDIFKEVAKLMDPQRVDTVSAFIKKEFVRIKDDESDFKTVQEMLSIVLKKAAKRFEAKDQSMNAGNVYEDVYAHRASLYPDTIETLEKLKKMGIKMILATDADADVLDKELDSLVLNQYFEHVIVSSEVYGYKPSIRFINELFRFCDDPKLEILFVGDLKVDIETAKRMGVKSVLLRRDGRFFGTPDYKIKSLRELFDIL